MFAAEGPGFRGEADIPKGTARRWAHETPSIKKLPEKVKKKQTKKANLELAFEIGKEQALRESSIENQSRRALSVLGG